MLTKKFHLSYLCTSLGWGGLEMNHLRNAIWMQERGHHVTLICTEGSPLHQSALKTTLSVISIQKPAKHYAFLSAFRLYQQLKRIQTEHVLIRSTFDLSLAASISVFSNRRIKTHFFMEMMFQGKKNQFFRTIRYRKLSSWVCSLEYMKNAVCSSTRMDPQKIHVISSALDFSQLCTTNQAEARRQLNLPQNVRIYGMVGRIDRKKRLDLAILAFAKLTDTKSQLIFIGEETPDNKDHITQELKVLIHANQLQDRVHFLGFNENPYLHYCAMDALIMASDFETFGMSTIESMAHQTPVIASNSAGSKELLEKFPFGKLFQPGNAESLSHAMASLDEIQEMTLDKVAFRNTFDHQQFCQIIETHILSLESAR